MFLEGNVVRVKRHFLSRMEYRAPGVRDFAYPSRRGMLRLSRRFFLEKLGVSRVIDFEMTRRIIIPSFPHYSRGNYQHRRD